MAKKAEVQHPLTKSFEPSVEVEGDSFFLVNGRGPASQKSSSFLKIHQSPSVLTPLYQKQEKIGSDSNERSYKQKTSNSCISEEK